YSISTSARPFQYARPTKKGRCRRAAEMRCVTTGAGSYHNAYPCSRRCWHRLGIAILAGVRRLLLRHGEKSPICRNTSIFTAKYPRRSLCAGMLPIEHRKKLLQSFHRLNHYQQRSLRIAHMAMSDGAGLPASKGPDCDDCMYRV